MSTTIETKVGVNSATVTFGELNQPFSEITGTFDNICRKLSILLQCDVKVADVLQKKIISTKNELAKIADTSRNHSVVRYGDAWNLIDGGFRKTTKNSFAKFSIRELLFRSAEFYREYNDDWEIEENSKRCSNIKYIAILSVRDRRDLGRTFAEMTLPFSAYADVPFFKWAFYIKFKKNNLCDLRFKDICNKSGKYRIDDSYNVTDLLNTSALFYRDYETSFALSDFNWFSYNINKSIGVMFSEYNKLHISVNNYTQFALTDGASTVAVFNRLFDYALSTQEVVTKSIKCLERETCSIRDAYVQNVNGTLSNIEIAEGESTLEQFLENAERIAGYTKFFDFKVGEYEYKDASVRVVLKAIDQVQPSAQGVTMHVDIPDTDDRGVAQITDTSGPTKVHFNKSYYSPPEVQVTLRNATTASGTIIPNIVSTSGEDEYGRFFEVELIGSSGSLTTGTISWVAKGY